MKDKLKWKLDESDPNRFLSKTELGSYAVVYSKAEQWWKAYYYHRFDYENRTILNASRDAGYLFDYCNEYHKKLQKEKAELENKNKIEVGSEWIYKNDENQVVEVLFLGKRRFFTGIKTEMKTLFL